MKDKLIEKEKRFVKDRIWKYTVWWGNWKTYVIYSNELPGRAVVEYWGLYELETGEWCF